jgi:hypothetical protein
MTREPPDPYQTLRDAAMALEAQGVGPDRIVDAMLTVGLNAGRILGGEDHMISYLHRMLTIFEVRTKRQPPPSCRTQ